jgi:hypothetical protein
MNQTDTIGCLIGWNFGNFLSDIWCIKKEVEKVPSSNYDYVADLPPELRSCIKQSNNGHNHVERVVME